MEAVETVLDKTLLVVLFAAGTVLGNLVLMWIVRWRSNKMRRDGLKVLQRFEEEMAAAKAEQQEMGDGEPS